MSDAQAVDAAHMTSGAGGDEHIAGRQTLGRSIEIQQVLLGLEHDSVFGFFIDFNL